MALCLEAGGLPKDRWKERLPGLPAFVQEAVAVERLHDFLLEQGLLVEVDTRLLLGGEGERRWERKHFLDLLSMITESPLFAVFHGRRELGQVDRASFQLERGSAPVILLGGQAWEVGDIDWKKKRCWVTPVELAGRSRWLGEGQPLSFELCQAMRELLAGEDEPGFLSRRGRDQLASLRQEKVAIAAAASGQTVLYDDGGNHLDLFTFAGLIVNASLAARMTQDGELEAPAFDNLFLRLPRRQLDRALAALAVPQPEGSAPPVPKIEARALGALKFADCLPPELLERTIRARWSDEQRASKLMATAPTRLNARPS